MSIRYTARARVDLEEIFTCIAKNNSRAAQRVRRAVLSAIGLVRDYPFLGIKKVWAGELRSLWCSRYPYRVHYCVRGEDIWILYIRHATQQPSENGP